MKHVLGGMSFPELLMRSIHAESTCLLQGHQVRIVTYLYKKKSFFSRFVLSIKSLNEKVILSKFLVVYFHDNVSFLPLVNHLHPNHVLPVYLNRALAKGGLMHPVILYTEESCYIAHKRFVAM